MGITWSGWVEWLLGNIYDPKNPEQHRVQQNEGLPTRSPMTKNLESSIGLIIRERNEVRLTMNLPDRPWHSHWSEHDSDDVFIFPLNICRY